jgi:hypothetical protein
MKIANPLFLKTVVEGLNIRTADDLKKILQLQQAAVAEAVYLTGGRRHQAEQFKAKYGALPQWRDRSSIYSSDSSRRPAAQLDLFFYPTGTYTASKH